MSQEIIKKEIAPIVTEVENMSINNSADMSQATSTLSQLNSFLDAMTEEKEKLTKPINEALKEIRARYKPTETVLEEAIATIKKKMGSYQQLALAEQKKAEAKIAEKVMAGKLKVETGIKKMSEVDTPDAKVKTDEGSVGFKPIKKFEVVDMTKLPMEYHLADEVKIRKTMQAGIELPGVRYYEELSVVNRRN